VPPSNEPVVVSVALCPESIVVGATEVVGAVSVALTVTAAAPDNCEFPLLSVTT
jgi:hypothetical protein